MSDRGDRDAMPSLERLAAEVRACRICRDRPQGAVLPHEPRPVLVVSPTARLMIAGQAPGTRVNRSGVPFSDPSGERLRDWLGLGADTFYDQGRVAILPMGFCFPGLDRKGGDLPPRPECARHWRHRLMAAQPQIELVLAIGLYAQRWHLGGEAKGGLTATVARFREHLADARRPSVLPLPHPSWRNSGWLKRNPWFEAELVPELRARVSTALAPG